MKQIIEERVMQTVVYNANKLLLNPSMLEDKPLDKLKGNFENNTLTSLFQFVNLVKRFVRKLFKCTIPFSFQNKNHKI